jgi:hypothetical protein
MAFRPSLTKPRFRNDQPSKTLEMKEEKNREWGGGGEDTQGSAGGGWHGVGGGSRSSICLLHVAIGDQLNLEAAIPSSYIAYCGT